MQPSLAFNLFARETVAFCTKQEIASISITWNRGKSGDIHTYMEESVLLGTKPLVDIHALLHPGLEWRIFRMSPLRCSTNTLRKLTKVLLGMEVKWYSVLVLLVGVILSFADPITDILTLVEFYRADHKTWFGVGLAFVILPCLLFLLLSRAHLEDDKYTHYTCTRTYVKTCLCGFHPFSAALRRLELFLLYLKQLMCSNEIDSHERTVAEDDLKDHIFALVFFESVLEAAPQFVIQLYAVSVQEEPVTVVQIISLPVSFLSLAWAFTILDLEVDERLGNGNARKVKYKLGLFVTQVLLLSGRLFAICYFTVGYKWWVLGVLFLHIFVLAIADTVWICQRDKCDFTMPFFLIIMYCLNWLRDDVSGLIQEFTNDQGSNKREELRRMQLFSNVLFVLGNLVMILLYYFSQHPNNWYSLPVTVCVCLLSSLAAVARVILFYFLCKDLDDQQQQCAN